MSSLYRNYIRLLERWPIDSTKTGRDFGEYLREQVKNGFRRGEVINDIKQCEKNYQSLNRLAGNYYLKQYPRTAEYSSCGLNAEYCKTLLHNDNLEEMPMGFVQKYLNRFRRWRSSIK